MPDSGQSDTPSDTFTLTFDIIQSEPHTFSEMTGYFANNLTQFPVDDNSFDVLVDPDDNSSSTHHVFSLYDCPNPVPGFESTPLTLLVDGLMDGLRLTRPIVVQITDPLSSYVSPIVPSIVSVAKGSFSTGQTEGFNDKFSTLQNQLGDIMTALKNATPLDQVDAQIITGAATTSGSPLPVPASGKNKETYRRTLTANLADYVYATSAPGRYIEQAFTNSAASGSFTWTINAQSGDVFNAPDLTAATSFVLQPGETRTFANTATGVWDEV